MWRGPGSKAQSVLEAAFAVPGDLSAPTGGYAYARKLLAIAPDHGVAMRHLPLPRGFPHPTAFEVKQTAQILPEAPGRVLLADGLAFGAFTPELLDCIRLPVVALVHHPLALETGLSHGRREELLASERSALARATAIVATSKATATTLAEQFAVPSQKLAVAEPGTESAPRALPRDGPVRLLAVGAISPRKGYDLLAAALAGLRGLDWRLAIAGSTERDPGAALRLRDAVAEAGLAERVALLGSVDDDALARLYAEADVLVSPSVYEGYGMVLAEGMARGLPLVASTGGAAADTVPDAAGLKVPPGDVPALRAAVSRMIRDADLRRRCAEGSWAAGQRLPRWTDTVATVASVLKAALR